MKIEIFSRQGLFKRKYYFRVRADNGQIVAQSEAYSRKIDAMSTAHSIKQNALMAEVIELTNG